MDMTRKTGIKNCSFGNVTRIIGIGWKKKGIHG